MSRLRVGNRNQKTRHSFRMLAVERLEVRTVFANVPITIFAAGDTGEENMDLLIDGQVVASWTNVGGDVAARQFLSFNYPNGPDGLTPERVRVAFTNDIYIDGGIDRNLVVDKIVLGTNTIQTESPSVYSTGTWLPSDGIVPGFRQSEYLNTDGYFQYAVVNSGSIIQIFASGEVGPESMSLYLDGVESKTWNDIGAGAVDGIFREFVYRAAGSIQPNQVRLSLNNDFYQDPIDYNLRVDRILIDGVEFQTESPTVYSTGVYFSNPGGLVPGYWETEWLNGVGYFQYAARTLNPGYFGLASSIYSVNESGNATITINRTVGSSGAVSIDYKTVSGTATNPADFTSTSGRLVFANGETQKTVTVPVINDTLREPPETFNFVIENPLGGASLLAPRTATVTIQDNDLILPNYTSFPNATGLKLNGNASVTASTLQLTPNTANQRGSAFYNTAIPLNASTSFQTQFRVATLGTTNGGDGFTFVVQNATTGSSSLGTGGSSLGYGGISKSLAIEFDTVANAGELNNNHISIRTNGNMVTALDTKAVSLDFNSGSSLYVWVDYYGDSDQLSLFIGNTTTKPTTPITTIPLDLFGIVGSQAFFGFTAATSTATNAHRVQSWSLNLNRPASAPVVPPANLVSETIVSGLNQPVSVRFSTDGRNTYIGEKAGKVIVVRDGITLATPFIDISGQVNNHDDRGLLDIAIHPDFANNPYVYLLYAYDPPEVYNNLTNAFAKPDGAGNRAGRLIRVTANPATNFTTAIPGSDVVLLGGNSTWEHFNAYIDSTVNIAAPPGGQLPDGSYIQDFIATDSSSHTVASLNFGVDGALLVSIGDGASYNTADPRATRVQDVDSLSGKILRIDPITGRGYLNNPFQNGNLDSNRSKVFQLGLRNPFRTAVNPNNGQVYIGDVGWTRWEEINVGGPGANFGWPYYEGGNGANIRTPQYEDLAKAQAFYASGAIASPSLLGLNHDADGINAIVLGDFYTGSTYPSKYQNNLFFNDLGQGIVRNVTFAPNGSISNIETFATGAVYVVQITQGRDGNMVYVDLDNGVIGRWKFVTPPASSLAAPSATSSSTPSPSFSSSTPAFNVLNSAPAIEIGNAGLPPLRVNASGHLAERSPSTVLLGSVSVPIADSDPGRFQSKATPVSRATTTRVEKQIAQRAKGLAAEASPQDSISSLEWDRLGKI